MQIEILHFFFTLFVFIFDYILFHFFQLFSTSEKEHQKSSTIKNTNKSKSKFTNYPDSSNSNFDRKFQILNKNALKIALKDESEIFNKLVNNGITGIAELKFCSDYELLDISTLLGFSNVEIHTLVRAIRLS